MAENPSAEAPPGNGANKTRSDSCLPNHGSPKSTSAPLPSALTRGFDAVYERLHLVVTLGLVCVEVGTGADDAPAPVPELTVGLVLFLPLTSIWTESGVGGCGF